MQPIKYFFSMLGYGINFVFHDLGTHRKKCLVEINKTHGRDYVMPKNLTIEITLEEFCFLTKRQKQKEALGPYQERLHQAYVLGERIIRLPASKLNDINN